LIHNTASGVSASTVKYVLVDEYPEAVAGVLLHLMEHVDGQQ